MSQCQELPGYELFEYVNENGEVCRIGSADVNHYLREITGQDFTAKDFRTWAGTVLAARELYAAGPADSETAAKTAEVSAVKAVSRRLGNRPATCRKYYIHPAIPDAYREGSLFGAMERGQEQSGAYGGLGLRPDEYCCLVTIADQQAGAKTCVAAN